MKRGPTREKAQAIFERKLLAAEKQGTLCNIRRCGHGGDKLACWADIYGLLFTAMRYGRRRGLLSIMGPWRDRSWLPKTADLATQRGAQ